MADVSSFPISAWSPEQFDAVVSELDNRKISYRIAGDVVEVDEQFTWFVNQAAAAAASTAVSRPQPSAPPDIVRQPVPTAPPPGAPASRPGRPWWMIVAAVVGVSVGVAAWFVQQQRTSDEPTDATGVEESDGGLGPVVTAPVGALALDASPSRFVAADGEWVITTANCAGLLAVVAGDQCVDLVDPQTDETLGAVVASNTDAALVVEAYRFDRSGTSLRAVMDLVAQYPHGGLSFDTDSTVTLHHWPERPDVIVVQHRVSPADGRVTASAEFLAAGGLGQIATRGSFEDAGFGVTSFDDGLFLVAQRYRDGDDACCPSAAILHSIYPVATGWMLTSEALSDDEIDQRVAGSIADRTVVVSHSTGPAPTTTTTTTTIAPPDPNAVATEQLWNLVDDDRFLAEELVGWWVPQISAKWEGLSIDGIEYGPREILDDHSVLRNRFAAVLIRSDGFQISSSRSMWVTLVPQTYSTSDGALGWCRANGIDRDNCFARLLTRDPSITRTAEYQ